MVRVHPPSIDSPFLRLKMLPAGHPVGIILRVPTGIFFFGKASGIAAELGTEEPGTIPGKRAHFGSAAQVSLSGFQTLGNFAFGNSAFLHHAPVRLRDVHSGRAWSIAGAAVQHQVYPAIERGEQLNPAANGGLA